jgi:hypothetical protein
MAGKGHQEDPSKAIAGKDRYICREHEAVWQAMEIHKRKCLELSACFIGISMLYEDRYDNFHGFHCFPGQPS